MGLEHSFLEQLFEYWGWLLLSLLPHSYSYLTNATFFCTILSISFFPYKQSLPLPFNTYRFLMAFAFTFLFPMPSSFFCFRFQHVCISFFLKINFQSFWQCLFCCVSLVHVEACCSLCQECVVLVWQECMEAIRCDVSVFQLPSLPRMSFLVPAPVKCCWCSSVFTVSMVADPIL